MAYRGGCDRWVEWGVRNLEEIGQRGDGARAHAPLRVAERLEELLSHVVPGEGVGGGRGDRGG